MRGPFRTARHLLLVPLALAGSSFSVPANSADGALAPSSLTVAGDTVFFAGTSAAGAELWKTDGTVSGTAMVRDISPGPASSSPAHLASYGGALFFSADDGVRGRELWKSDGTEPGTFLVRDLTPGSGSTSFQSQLIVANGLLFFLVERERPTLSLRRTELWRTDGSQAGTFVVHDASYSFFYDIQMGSRDGTNGLDLWRSGDFDGDGRADILWRKVGPGLDTGAPYIWPMIGPDVSAGTYLDPTGADWKVVGAADLNGDGRSDILWRNMNPSALDAGFLYVWLMDGARPIAGTGYTNSQANFTWDVENPR